jgi:pullulanase
MSIQWVQTAPKNCPNQMLAHGTMAPSPDLTEASLMIHFLRRALAGGLLALTLTSAVSPPVYTPRMLDIYYAYPGNDLGLTFRDGRPTLRLWAPTATQVKVNFRSGESYPMQRGSHGVWILQGQPDWKGAFYRFEVTRPPMNGGPSEIVETTDPYSLSLATNSSWSQISDLSDPALKPPGWDDLRPVTHAPEDMVLYELHLRDFSIADPSVPLAHRGTYLAFTHPESHGMKHLKALATAGVTHVHLLPVFDIATINEDRSQQINPQIPEGLPPDSPQQQELVGLARQEDGYNWGYDPYHYGVPEGSYATDPEGPTRVYEFRQMVQALHGAGLQVVMDVVYNHTHAAGNSDRSVLDKIVPGYYYRYKDGKVEQTSCCPDTASERAMMEKLMVDTLVRWAREYKVSGFRFDLMGHHTTTNLKKVRTALDQLTLEKDGIDGKGIYLYGEGWSFGSLQATEPKLAMNQGNAFGMGIGTFNDRLRDSARGGNFSHDTKADQGFITGLYTDPSLSPAAIETPTDLAAQKKKLLAESDALRIGLAGNLRDYELVNAEGKKVKGGEIRYRGNPGAGYTAQPRENILYVSAHDNYILWDQIQAKAPWQTPKRGTATPEERLRMQMLGFGLVLMGQGVPFLHAGDELLRSKSGDGDSYDSGDWWNAIDWTGATQAWGKGLPPAWRNQQDWDFWRPRLADPALKTTPELRHQALAQVLRLLQVRQSTPLLRLKSAEDIHKRLRFANTGPQQIPGLIAFEIRDDVPGQPNLDAQRKAIHVWINAAPQPAKLPLLHGPLQLHPTLQQTVTLPGGQVIPPLETNVTERYALPGVNASAVIPGRSILVYDEPEKS